MRDADTIRTLRSIVAHLEDENQALRDTIQGDRLDEDAKKLMVAFGLSLAPARFLYRLYRGGGQVVSHTVLNAATHYRQTRLDYATNNIPEFRVNNTFAHQVRKVCPHVKNTRGIGFYLTPEGLAIIKRILDGPQDV